ncbi:DNA cytosine methyltransferase [uncultured Veillonella sp.]|jgi:cytosine-specific methyltransferase|uniref:DNA cytosine methyltransferase n=1 Tax=uncultured Veillonella sp. TaxID=159268 RepID=UPI0026743C7B|nr:DNA cytosine methyltransferase [uncultured Veillonella sp.]
MIQNKPTYISLFSSAGVGCYGFKLEGFECIATNELLEKRLNIQRLNKKCKFESGYISADIKQEETKNLIYEEIKKWNKLGNDRVDVVIATPPCQGMSVANHKKSDKEIERNSLIRESVELIKTIHPRFFLFENVAAFWKTGCINKRGDVVSIGDMISEELGSSYLIHNEVLNFKNYGSNSSRTRTLVIGVDKKFSDEISPIELMPDYEEEKSLFDVIGNMKSLNWGEYDSKDFFHSFRVYPEYMLPWIENLEEGQSAFDNNSDELKPHRVIDGKIVLNKSKNADKYTRQVYDKVAPCIHTRNDQLASQNTIHPIDNRVFSIRELMRMMTIPDEFKWLDYNLSDLNQLSVAEKQKVSKKEELNIRQSIGEAVPTVIFRQIANKIKKNLLFPKLTYKEIKELIDQNNLVDNERLKQFLYESKNIYSLSTLSAIIELANTRRQVNSAYFTNKFIIQEIFKNLPDFDSEELNIIEPSVGAGNFLPFIFKKYERKKHVNLTVIDVDFNTIEALKILYDKDKIPHNFTLKFICDDFMTYKFNKVDLIIGNPPFSKISGLYRNNLLKDNFNKESTNLAEFILEKAVILSNYVSLIMPKNILNTPEFLETRAFLSPYGIDSIIDFGENGFKGVLVETINIMVDSTKKSVSTKVISTTMSKSIVQKSKYIFDNNLPYWIIYRDDFFDKVFCKMKFGIFDVFRDRQITNQNTSQSKSDKYAIRVLKSRNILDTGELVDIDGYDAFIDLDTLSKFTVSKFINNTEVYLTPNMTYKPRMIKKDAGYVVNGSVAILIPKDENLYLTDKQLKYISSDEFRAFYRIARNYQTRSLNIDKTSCYWFGMQINNR